MSISVLTKIFENNVYQKKQLLLIVYLKNGSKQPNKWKTQVYIFVYIYFFDIFDMLTFYVFLVKKTWLLENNF